MAQLMGYRCDRCFKEFTREPETDSDAVEVAYEIATTKRTLSQVCPDCRTYIHRAFDNACERPSGYGKGGD